MPFFISAWGSAYYGEWLTLTIIPSVIAFSDLGFGSAAASYFVLTYASGDKAGAANIAKSGFFVISLVVFGATVISGISLILLSYYNFFQNSLIDEHDVIISVSILILARLITFYSQLYEAKFRAARRAALSINLLSISSGLNIVAGLIVLSLGYGVIMFSLGQLIVAVVFTIYYCIKADMVLGLSKTEKGKLLKNDIRAITKKGFGYLLSPMWQVVYFQGTTFVVRLTLGPQAVAVFNTVRTLTRSVNQFYNMVNSTVFPELQYEIGTGNMAKAQKLFRISVIVVFLLSIVGALFLAIFGSWFYGVWTNNELIVPNDMWLIFIAGVLFNALWSTAAMVFRAVNKPYGFSIVAILSAIVSVLLSYWLSIKMGLTGAAIGSFALDLILAFYILPVSSKLMGISISNIISNGKQDIKEIIILYKRKVLKKNI